MSEHYVQRGTTRLTIPKHLWMLRAGDNNELANQVEDKQAVAIGWAEMGDL